MGKRRKMNRKMHILFVCVFLLKIAKGTREVTQTIQFILDGLIAIVLYTNRRFGESGARPTIFFRCDIDKDPPGLHDTSKLYNFKIL